MQLNDKVTRNIGAIGSKMAIAEFDMAAAQSAACEQEEGTATRVIDFRTREAAEGLNIMLGGTVTRKISTLEDVSEVAPMAAVFSFNALPGQSLRVSHSWQLE